MEKKKLKIKCPQCSKEYFYHDSKWRPFCSERCKMIDLGHWISETYSISSIENSTDNKKKDK